MAHDRADRTFPALRLAAGQDDAEPATAMRTTLKELAERLEQHHSLSRGQFVRWKPGLKNRKFPDYGEPSIVTAVLPTPVFDPSETSAASPYFREALTLVIGTYRDEDLIEFHVDGRRFEPADE